MRSTSLKILILSEVRGDTRRYRALHLVEQLRLLGVHCEFVHMADPGIWEKAAQPWDGVVFQRVAFGGHVERLVDQFRRRGTLILSDFDDLIFDPEAFQYIDSPDFVDPIRAEMYVENMRNIHRMLMECEGVLASTDFLAQRIAQMGKPVWIHRNAFSLEMLAQAEKARAEKQLRPDRIVIGYASGTLTHNRDFELVKPAVQAVMRRHSQTVLRLVGPLDPGGGWEGLEGRLKRMKLVPWRKLPEVLAGFDINLAPLVKDNPFAQSKSEIKYMEAAMVETPTIASATDAFCFAIRDGENGLLAEDAGGWEASIERLVQEPEMRVQLGKMAYQMVRENYHPVRRAQQLAATLDEMRLRLRDEAGGQVLQTGVESLNARAQARSAAQHWLPRRYEQDPSNFALGLYSLRHKGPWTLARQVWIYLRRKLAPLFPFSSQKGQ